MSSPPPDTAPPLRSTLRWSWASTDNHRPLTALAVAGTAAATAMALLGLPPVDLHGPLHHLGIMDPLCGGTRAARYTMLGEWRRAWQYNPLGIAAAVGAAVVAGRAVVGVVARRWLNLTVVWTPQRRRLVFAVAIVAIVALEIRQQSLAPLLSSSG